jgi:hypothetical protein
MARLTPFGIDNLEVGQMADDFQSGSLARDGAGNELLGGHSGHGLPQQLRASEVVFD